MTQPQRGYFISQELRDAIINILANKLTYAEAANAINALQSLPATVGMPQPVDQTQDDQRVDDKRPAA